MGNVILKTDENTTLSVNEMLLCVKPTKQSISPPTKENPVSKQVHGVTSSLLSKENGKIGFLLSKTKTKILPASEYGPGRTALGKKKLQGIPYNTPPCQTDYHINSSNRNPRAHDASHHKH